MPGATRRNASANRRSCGLAALLRVCQAISIAMTTVLPVPVAILWAMRNTPGFGVVGHLAEVVLDPGVTLLPGHLSDVDGRLQRLDLPEEQRPLAGRIGPVLEQATSGRRDARPAGVAPATDAVAHLVDELALLDPVGRPLRLELELAALLLRLRDRHEVRRGPATLDHLVGDALLAEAEVPRRLRKGAVEDRVLDDGLRSGHEGPA